jgi:pSer/pThr/pTyr-binding forkhead associated (FHA) protein
MRFCGACGSRLDGSVPAPQPAGGAPAKTQFLHAPEVAVAQPKARLIVIDQTGKEGMQFNLKAAETLCGRVNGIILFFDDPYVSPSHCVFRFAGGRLSVEDVGSLNGVFLRLRSEVELQGGDMVRLGRQLVRFEDESALPPEEVRRGPDDDSRLWGSPEAKVFGRLVQVLEDGRVGDVRVLRGTEVRVGREVGDILFPMDGFVSGQHCLVSTRAGRVYLRDLGSSNGTYLRVRGPRELAQDDFLLMGNQLLRVDQR